ncbi:zinc knuckle CX2CX4HX4C containing protein [Tanacetum coccineum]
MFEELGLYYVGPVDGHNLDELVYIFKKLKSMETPKAVLVHIVTEKGKGYHPAFIAPDKMHGLATEGLKPFCAIYSSFHQRGYDQVLYQTRPFLLINVYVILDYGGLRDNEKGVEGDDVAIPLAAVDEKVKVDAPTQELNDGFVEVTRKQGKGKQNGKHQHIDGVQLTKPQPNYFYRVVSNPVNVNDEVSTSQPKGNREATSQPKSNVNNIGNLIDDLVDKTRKNVDVPLMKLAKRLRGILTLFIIFSAGSCDTLIGTHREEQ